MGTTLRAAPPRWEALLWCACTLAALGIVPVRAHAQASEIVLHSFVGLTDGEVPAALAGVIRDSAGNLYGTTPHNGPAGEGVVYKVEDLQPILRDEVYRIAAEALRNAFHHARARQIEVEVRYDALQLRVRVRDDGIGIDASVLSGEGHSGHFGLSGMRERAKAIGGQLEVWSEHGAGTEIELTVPGSVAYQARTGRRLRFFKNKVGTNS